MRKTILITIIALLACTGLQAQVKWTATWATAQMYAGDNNMPKTSMTDNALRQVIHVSLGGEKLRLQLSNEQSTEPLEIKSVYIADAKDGGEIDPATAEYLEFDGKKGVTIQPGEAVYTDAAKFALEPLQLLSITINYGKTPANATFHNASHTTSYLMIGQSKPKSGFSAAEKVGHWYNIAALEVETPVSTRCIACIGNSITDGSGSTTDAHNRWTDVLAERLGGKVGVINLGIGGNCVLMKWAGKPALERFGRDVLQQQGVTDVVIFEGVNDIIHSKRYSEETAKKLPEAYLKLVSQAREKGLRVYGGTIMPFKNNNYWSFFREAARQEVNKWIRTSGAYDGVIDFDRKLRNPQEADELRPECQSDWLHPNAEGYKMMGGYAASVVGN